MSVLVPDLKVYEQVARKMKTYQFRNVCDINYCYALSRKGDEEINQFVSNLLDLNEMSWNALYTEDPEQPELKHFLKWDADKTISTLQLFKFLQCIDYNIEIETIESGFGGMKRFGYGKKPNEQLMASYKLLKNVIQELSFTLIKELTDYDQMKWSDVA